MISSREDFLMSLLHCSSYDLKLIDGVDYDWCDILDSGVLDVDFSLPSVMSAVFNHGKQQIEEAIRERVDYLEDNERTYGISKKRKPSLKHLKKLSLTKTLKSITTILIRTLFA